MCKYDAFISYVYNDNNDGYLQDFIKQLKNNNIKVWYAKKKIKVSDEWKTKIKKAIQDCLFFIPFITKNYIHKEWTQFELVAAKYHSKVIIPLIIEEGVPKKNDISKLISKMIKDLHSANSKKEENVKIIANQINSLKGKEEYKYFENDISFVEKVKHLHDKHSYLVQNYYKYKNIDCIEGDYIMIRSEYKVKQEEIIVKCYDSPLLDNDIDSLNELIDCVNKNKNIHKLRIFISKDFYVKILKSMLDSKLCNNSIYYDIYDIYDYFQILDDYFQFNKYLKKLKKKEDNINLKYNELSPDNEIILKWYRKNESSCLMIFIDNSDSIDTFNYHITRNFINHPHRYPLPVYIKCDEHQNKNLENIIYNELNIKKDIFYDLSKNKYQMVFIFDCLNFSYDNDYFKELMIEILKYKKAQKIIITCQKESIKIIEQLKSIHLNSAEEDISNSISEKINYEHVVF